MAFSCPHWFSLYSVFLFLLLARYVPNVAERSVWEQCNIVDRPTRRPTDLAFCKISNGHISATGHPIHFKFGSRVGFSRTADRMALFPVGPGGWPPSWKISNGRISGTGRPIDFLFYPRVGFSGTADRIALFPVSPNSRWRLSWKISNEMSYPIHFHELQSSLEE